MNIEQIHANKPEGATGYYIDEYDNEIYYFKIADFEVYQFIDNEWYWVDDLKDCPDYNDDLNPFN